MIFEIDKKFIYINSRTFDFLEQIVLDGKDRHEFADKIFGPDHSWLDIYDQVLEEIYNLIQSHLETQARKNWPKFWKDYGTFNYNEIEAKENAAGIIYSFGTITKLLDFVPKNKTIAAKISHEQMSGSKLYTPIAKEFFIQFDTRRKNMFLTFFKTKWDSFLDINSKDVLNINGEVTNFSMTIDNYVLFCSHDTVTTR
jgi:hypothetical protein